MAAPRRYATDQAAALLRAHYGDPRIEVEPLSGGNWSTAFGFRHDGADLVARFGRHPDDYRKDAWAAQWSSPAVPIPAVLEVAAVDDEWWYAVSTRARGVPLESVAPGAWPALVPAVVDLVAACASLPYDPALGVGRWGPGGRAPHQRWGDLLLEVADDGPDHRIAGWRAALATHPTAQAAFDRGLDALAGLAAEVTPPLGVVHADLTNANVLVDGGGITAVLDWGSAMYGDPLHEVAWLGYWAPWQPDLAGSGVIEAALADPRVTAGGDVERRLRACRLHIGLGHLAYHAWADDPVWLERLTALVLADCAA